MAEYLDGKRVIEGKWLGDDLTPIADDTYWIGKATHGFIGFIMADTLITDESGYVKLRNAADSAYVGLQVTDIILRAGTAPANTLCYIVRDNTGDVTINALTGKEIHLAVHGVDELDIGEIETVVNEGGNDRDFRVETDNLAVAFQVNGGMDALGIGQAADANHFLRIRPPAKTSVANVSFAHAVISPAGSVTVPTGTTAVVGSLVIHEPDITATGTVTIAATLYIVDAPTEGASNYAVYIASGATGLQDLTLAGDLAIADTKAIQTGAVDDDYVLFKAVDNDTQVLTEVARLTGASIPTFDINAGRLTGHLIMSGDYSIGRGVNSGEFRFTGGIYGTAGSGAWLTLYGHAHGTHPGKAILSTTNAAGNGDVERLVITGAAATAVATWANVTHTGLKLSGALDVDTQHLKYKETSNPGAVADSALVYARLVDGGKTELVVLFQSGAAVQIAVEA